VASTVGYRFLKSSRIGSDHQRDEQYIRLATLTLLTSSLLISSRLLPFRLTSLLPFNNKHRCSNYGMPSILVFAPSETKSAPP
jgi:hypothetical protein